MRSLLKPQGAIAYIIGLLALFVFPACAVPKKTAESPVTPVSNMSQAAPATTPSDLEREILEADAALSPPESALEGSETDQPVVPDVAVQLPALATGKIPVEINENVQKWIDYFTKKDSDRFRRFLQRGSAYRQVVQDILAENGVPPELYFLAMIESGYVTHARSHASAIGVWQFIRATGKRYGLQADAYVDERRDPIRATEAAAKYLKDLYNVFQSWYLAMAAYNAGERRILNAIMRGKSRDFWTLVEKRVLPRETMEYVPKFLAAVVIGGHPEKYGFNDIGEVPYPEVHAVEVPSSVRLSDIARLSQVSADALKQVNPHLRRGITPPGGGGTYEIWVPKDQASRVQATAGQLAAYRVKGLKASSRSYAQESDRHYHRVSRGETLGVIARKHKLSVAYLKRVNKLRSNHIRVGQRLRLDAPSYERPQVMTYRVRRGDSLSEIARRFGISINALKKMNGLRRNQIYAGQSLRVQQVF